MINWWNEIDFAYHWVLWLLLAIPVFILLLIFFSGAGRPAVSLSSLRFLEGIKAPGIVKWKIVLYFIRILAAVLIVLAIARPQTKSDFEQEKGEGIDIMICMDVSGSMGDAMTDTSDAKFNIAKREATRFIQKRPNDRIGMVIFASNAITSCPLTTDHSSLYDLINMMSLDNNLGPKTAIGMGLATAVERLESSKAKSKVIILLTDGANNSGEIQPIPAAQLAKTYGIRVYTIGISPEGGMEYSGKTKNPDGSSVMQYTHASVDIDQLTQMAELTGGHFYLASDDSKLGKIYDLIDRLETTDYEIKGQWKRKEEAAYFLFPALLLLFVEFGLRYTVFDSLT